MRNQMYRQFTHMKKKKKRKTERNTKKKYKQSINMCLIKAYYNRKTNEKTEYEPSDTYKQRVAKKKKRKHTHTHSQCEDHLRRVQTNLNR